MAAAAAVHSLAAALSPNSPASVSQLLRRAVVGRRIRARAWTIRSQAAAGGDGGAGNGAGDGDDDFEARLAKLQRKVTSGTGKKAELRKARKQGTAGDVYSSSSTKTKENVFIPPVPLKEPTSDGVIVELGFTPYTERLHGRLAAIGLAAVLLVELASSESLVKFHDPGTLFVQVYTVLGLATAFVKYEKERISVWPKS